MLLNLNFKFVFLFIVVLMMSSCGGSSSTPPTQAATPSSPTVAPISTPTPTTPIPIVAKPTQLTASDATFTNYVQVSWATQEAGVTFDVFRADTSSGLKSKIRVGINANVYNDTSATAGVIYYYWAEAVNGAGIKSGLAGGDPGSRSMPPATPQLLPPTNVQASDNTSTAGVKITWGASPNVTSYFIYRNTLKTLTGASPLPAVAASTVSTIDTTALAGVTYWYWVVSYRTGSPTQNSLPDRGTRLVAAPAMIPPANVLASTSFTGEIQVDWDTVPGAVSYDLYRKVNTTTATAMLLQAALPSTTYNDTSAIAGSSYYYSVIAVDMNNVKGVRSSDSNMGVALAGAVIAPGTPGAVLPPPTTNPNAGITTVYATYDNQLVGDTFGSHDSTVYDQSELGIGCNYIYGIAFSSILCSQSLVYFDLPMISGKTINSATLRLYPRLLATDPNAVTYQASMVASSWNAYQVSWALAPQWYLSPTISANVPTSTFSPMDINVTQAVQYWANGLSNAGFYLHSISSTFNPVVNVYEMTSFDSLEVYSNVSRRPQLIINYQ